MLANKAVKVFVSIELSMIVETDNKQVNRKMNVTVCDMSYEGNQ